MNGEIKTVGDLRQLIKNIDDDFNVRLSIIQRLSAEELRETSYPYPYKTKSSNNLVFVDIGYSDKVLCFDCELLEEDVKVIEENPNSIKLTKRTECNGLCPCCDTVHDKQSGYKKKLEELKEEILFEKPTEGICMSTVAFNQFVEHGIDKIIRRLLND